MSDLWKIVLTASFTLIGGMILFVLGEFVRTLVIVPLQKYKEHVETILDRLDFYANFYTRVFDNNPSDEQRQDIVNYMSHMRSAASQLNAKYTLVGWKSFLIWRKTIPSAEKIEQAHKSLIYLSNSILFKKDLDEHNKPIKNSEEADKIRSSLIIR